MIILRFVPSSHRPNVQHKTQKKRPEARHYYSTTQLTTQCWPGKGKKKEKNASGPVGPTPGYAQDAWDVMICFPCFSISFGVRTHYIYWTILGTFITYVRYLVMSPFLWLGLCLADVSLHLTYIPRLRRPIASPSYIASPIYLDSIVRLQAPR